jgi:hypothetical protein
MQPPFDLMQRVLVRFQKLLMTFFNNLRFEGSSHAILQNGITAHLFHSVLPVLWIRTRIPLGTIRIRVPNPYSERQKSPGALMSYPNGLKSSN